MSFNPSFQYPPYSSFSQTCWVKQLLTFTFFILKILPRIFFFSFASIPWAGFTQISIIYPRVWMVTQSNMNLLSAQCSYCPFYTFILIIYPFYLENSDPVKVNLARFYNKLPQKIIKWPPSDWIISSYFT